MPRKKQPNPKNCAAFSDDELKIDDSYDSTANQHAVATPDGSGCAAERAPLTEASEDEADRLVIDTDATVGDRGPLDRYAPPVTSSASVTSSPETNADSASSSSPQQPASLLEQHLSQPSGLASSAMTFDSRANPFSIHSLTSNMASSSLEAMKRSALDGKPGNSGYTFNESAKSPAKKTRVPQPSKARKKTDRILPTTVDGGTEHFQCPVCKMELNSLPELTKHIRSHNQVQASANSGNTCTICQKVLSSQSSLDRHMLVHSGERPFFCKICGMSFTTNGNMHRHSRIHVKDDISGAGSSSVSQVPRNIAGTPRKGKKSTVAEAIKALGPLPPNAISAGVLKSNLPPSQVGRPVAGTALMSSLNQPGSMLSSPMLSTSMLPRVATTMTSIGRGMSTEIRRNNRATVSPVKGTSPQLGDSPNQPAASAAGQAAQNGPGADETTDAMTLIELFGQLKPHMPRELMEAVLALDHTGRSSPSGGATGPELEIGEIKKDRSAGSDAQSEDRGASRLNNTQSKKNGPVKTELNLDKQESNGEITGQSDGRPFSAATTEDGADELQSSTRVDVSEIPFSVCGSEKQEDSEHGDDVTPTPEGERNSRLRDVDYFSSEGANTVACKSSGHDQRGWSGQDRHCARCEHCDTTFPCPATLRLHRRFSASHPSARRGMCIKCGAAFVSLVSWLTHSLSHVARDLIASENINGNAAKPIAKSRFLAGFSLVDKKSLAIVNAADDQRRSLNFPGYDEAPMPSSPYRFAGPVTSVPSFDSSRPPRLIPSQRPPVDFRAMQDLAKLATMYQRRDPYSSCYSYLPPDSYRPFVYPMSVLAMNQPQLTVSPTLDSPTVSPRQPTSGGSGGPTSNSPITCETCGESLPNLKAYRAHRRTHDGLTPYKCTQCSYISTDKSTLIRHMRTHNGERPFKCRLCSYPFTTKANCERHLRNKHCRTENVDCLIISSFDGKEYTGSESPFVCRKCGEDQLSPTSFSEHMQSCFERDTSSSDARSLPRNSPSKSPLHHDRAPNATTDENVPLDLSTRKRSPPSPNSLHWTQEHLTSGEVVVDLTKDNALASVKRRLDLDSEEIDGDEERRKRVSPERRAPLKCPNCSTEFESQSQLWNHIENIHGPDERCSYCTATFDTSAGLADHIRTSHRMTKQRELFSCEICSCEFDNRHAAMQHVGARHPRHDNAIIRNRNGLGFLGERIGHLQPHDHSSVKPKAYEVDGNMNRLGSRNEMNFDQRPDAGRQEGLLQNLLGLGDSAIENMIDSAASTLLSAS